MTTSPCSPPCQPGMPARRSAAVVPALVTTLVAAALTAGCAGIPDPTGLLGGGAQPQAEAPGTLPERVAEAGPAAPTAVIEESFTLDGAILPVTRGTSRTEIRADRKRTDSAVTFDNWLMRRLAPDGRTSDIIRLDQSLAWQLVPARREYTECPLTGCTSGKPGEDGKADPQQPKPHEPDCPVKLRANDLKVQATGERRTINGFETERMKIDWLLEIVDEAGGASANRIQVDLWTTPESGAVKQVQTISDSFNRRYLAALTTADSPVGRYLPKNLSTMLGSLMQRVDPDHRKSAARWESELKKVRGYPISTAMTWAVDGQICGKGGGQGGDGASAAGIASMLGNMLGGGKAGSNAGPTPIATFNHEVKSVTVKPVADAVFTPPADYRKTN